MTNYALGCAFQATDLFLNFPYDKLKLTCKDCEKINNNPHRNFVVRKIFDKSLELILNDVIDNNVTFELPLNGKVKADIHMKRFSGDEFKRLRKAGKWQDVDILESNFSANQLGFFMYGKRTPRVKNIYVDKNLRNKITKNTNEGKQYC